MKFELGRGTPERNAKNNNTEIAENKVKTRHKRQKRLALSLDCARQVRHRRLQPTRDPCQKHYCKGDWPERKNLVLSRSLSESQRSQTTPSTLGLWPLPNARSGVDNLTMMCSAEPHMWRPYKAQSFQSNRALQKSCSDC